MNHPVTLESAIKKIRHYMPASKAEVDLLVDTANKTEELQRDLIDACTTRDAATGTIKSLQEKLTDAQNQLQQQREAIAKFKTIINNMQTRAADPAGLNPYNLKLRDLAALTVLPELTRQYLALGDDRPKFCEDIMQMTGACWVFADEFVKARG